MTTQFRDWMCYRCGYVMSAASSLRDDKLVPKEGDLSACIACAAPYTLRAGRWRPMTDTELAQLDPEERRELTLHQMAVAEMLATLGKPSGKRSGRA